MKTAQNLFRFAALLPNDQENPKSNEILKEIPRSRKWTEVFLWKVHIPKENE